jgi:hypothetical protein
VLFRSVRQTDELRIVPSHSASLPLFTAEAKRRIYQLTDGIPRFINLLCGTALQLAAERKTTSIDGSLVNDAWASLNHIKSDSEAEETNSVNTQEPVISPEHIEEIVDRKKKTFQLRQFDSVEFGTLTDSDAVETEVLSTYKSFHENEYKPPYPEDEDVVDEDLEEELLVYRLPGVPAELPEVPAKLPKAFVLPKRKFVPASTDKQRQKSRRRALSQKIQQRSGLFTLLLRKAEPPQPPLTH